MPTPRRSFVRWSTRRSCPRAPQLSTKLVDQGSQAGDLLGIALLINRDPAVPTVDDPQRDTVLAALRDTGFIGYGNQHIGAANAALSSPAAALGEDAGNQGVSVARFAAALAPHGSGTLLAGRDGSRGTAAVAVTRADAGGDVGDQHRRRRRTPSPGGSPRSWAWPDLINGGRPGQYGTGHGATAHRRASKAQRRRRRACQRRRGGVDVRVGFRGSAGPKLETAKVSPAPSSRRSLHCASIRRAPPSTSSSAAASCPRWVRA